MKFRGEFQLNFNSTKNWICFSQQNRSKQKLFFCSFPIAKWWYEFVVVVVLVVNDVVFAIAIVNTFKIYLSPMYNPLFPGSNPMQNQSAFTIFSQILNYNRFCNMKKNENKQINDIKNNYSRGTSWRCS